MPSRITVRVTGQIGLDDIDELRAYLAKETELDWHQESRPDREHLSGIVESFLIGMTAGIAAGRANAAIDVIVAQVREAIRRWRDQWLEPLDVDVTMEELPAADETEDSADAESSERAI